MWLWINDRNNLKPKLDVLNSKEPRGKWKGK